MTRIPTLLWLFAFAFAIALVITDIQFGLIDPLDAFTKALSVLILWRLYVAIRCALYIFDRYRSRTQPSLLYDAIRTASLLVVFSAGIISVLVVFGLAGIRLPPPIGPIISALAIVAEFQIMPVMAKTIRSFEAGRVTDDLAKEEGLNGLLGRPPSHADQLVDRPEVLA